MTDRSPVPPARLVAATTLAMFLAAFALLVYQLRSGRDPVLRPGVAAAVPQSPPPRRVLVRELIITRVVVHLPDEAAPAAAPVSIAPTHARAPAPAAAPPVSAPAPVVSAPAPAPAPITTRSS